MWAIQVLPIEKEWTKAVNVGGDLGEVTRIRSSDHQIGCNNGIMKHFARSPLNEGITLRRGRGYAGRVVAKTKVRRHLDTYLRFIYFGSTGITIMIGKQAANMFQHNFNRVTRVNAEIDRC